MCHANNSCGDIPIILYRLIFCWTYNPNSTIESGLQNGSWNVFFHANIQSDRRLDYWRPPIISSSLMFIEETRLRVAINWGWDYASQGCQAWMMMSEQNRQQQHPQLYIPTCLARLYSETGTRASFAISFINTVASVSVHCLAEC